MIQRIFKSKPIIGIIIFSLLLVAGLILGYENGLFDDLRPKDYTKFELIFRYGVDGKNVLNTFTDNYVKDLVQDGKIAQTQLVLTPQEKEKIYQKMNEIGFFSYPQKFEIPVKYNQKGQKITQDVTPYSTYYFKVKYNHRYREVTWADDVVTQDEQAMKLK